MPCLRPGTKEDKILTICGVAPCSDVNRKRVEAAPQGAFGIVSGEIHLGDLDVSFLRDRLETLIWSLRPCIVPCFPENSE